MMKHLLAIATSAILLHGCASATTPKATPPIVHLPPTCRQNGVHLTIVGDSLARGWGASAPQNTFAARIYRAVRQGRPQTTLQNLGIPGATSDEIATKEVPLIRAHDCSLIVIVAGANDVQKLYTPRHFRVSYANLLHNIRARAPHAALVVMGLPDVALSPRIPWILKPLESALSRAGNKSIAAAAREHGAAFVPLYAVSHENAFRSKRLLSNDGIHPNDDGYGIMAAAASPTIMMLMK